MFSFQVLKLVNWKLQSTENNLENFLIYKESSKLITPKAEYFEPELGVDPSEKAASYKFIITSYFNYSLKRSNNIYS